MNPEVKGHLVVAAGAPVSGAEWSDGGARSGGEDGGGEGGGERRRDGYTAVHHTLRQRERETTSLLLSSGFKLGSVSPDVEDQSDDREMAG